MNEPRQTDREEEPQRRLFLERRSYTRRRILDGARLLPIVGFVLWMLPLIWPAKGAEGAIATSNATLYIFAIWIGLILLGAYLAIRMAPSEAGDENSVEREKQTPPVHGQE